uniref:Uncharacterized protein n=1 Tax=Glossina pallidipes TaxID=7398 RepID=A0A1A9ZXU9_GLOPL
MQSFQKLLLDIERHRQKALPPQTPNIKGAKSHYRMPRRKETLIDLSNILPNVKESLGQKAYIYYKSLKSSAKTTDDNVEGNILGEISPSVSCQGKSSQRSSIKTLSKAYNKASNNSREINAPDEEETSDSETPLYEVQKQIKVCDFLELVSYPIAFEYKLKRNLFEMKFTNLKCVCIGMRRLQVYAAQDMFNNIKSLECRNKQIKPQVTEISENINLPIISTFYYRQDFKVVSDRMRRLSAGEALLIQQV